MLKRISIVVLAMMAMNSCSLIDDDTDDCGEDIGVEYKLNLVTNLNTELQTELSAETETHVAQALKTALKDIFTDHAHDIDLSFYNADDERELHEQHIMDASQASYQLFLPAKNYNHLALANIANASATLYVDSEHSQSAKLDLVEGDTIECLRTGIFTARKQINVTKGKDQTFDVHLYMANCAAALVVDLNGHEALPMKVFATGFANEFMMTDSVYHYDRNHFILGNEVALEDDNAHQCFFTVNYPSRDSKTATKADDDSGLWRMYAYVTLPSGKVTKNVLDIEEPLKAGHLKIIKVRLQDDGRMESTTRDVGVSVTLDWKDGGTYEPIL